MNAAQREYWRLYASIYDVIWDSPLTLAVNEHVVEKAELADAEETTDDSEKPVVGNRGERYAVDLGCGTGLMAGELKRSGWFVTGVDCTPSMLIRARSHGRTTMTRYASAERTGLPGASADLVVISNLLQLAENPAAILDEALRLARPSGRILCVWPAEGLTLGKLFLLDRMSGRGTGSSLVAAAARLGIGIPGAVLGARAWSGAEVRARVTQWAEEAGLSALAQGVAGQTSEFAVFEANAA